MSLSVEKAFNILALTVALSMVMKVSFIVSYTEGALYDVVLDLILDT